MERGVGIEATLWPSHSGVLTNKSKLEKADRYSRGQPKTTNILQYVHGHSEVSEQFGKRVNSVYRVIEENSMSRLL